MNIKITLVKYLLLSVMFVSTATFAANDKMRIRTVFDNNKSFCAIKTNGVLGMDNRDSAVFGEGYGTSSTNSMLMLENGENNITVEMGAMGWFSKEQQSSEEKNAFSKDSSCKLELVLFKGNERSTLTSLEIKIDDKGIPTATEASNNDVIYNKVNAYQASQGHVPEEYFLSNYYPQGMELHQFTKKIYLNGLPKWKWVNATPFVGSPEQMAALRNAYSDFWKMLATKNNDQLKQYLAVSTSAWVDTTGESADDIYNSNTFVEAFKNKGFKMIPINWQDYEVEVMNNNRLVRFINKSIPVISPLSNELINDDGKKSLGYFSPIFAFIDEKFIPVI
ncbi:hypothetical protein [Siccibacter colletis]|uniref:hypothetical protein n=1 Tax=Siccibacter colletis TaxID=1505757 RepID=UPI003CF8CE89